MKCCTWGSKDLEPHSPRDAEQAKKSLEALKEEKQLYMSLFIMLFTLMMAMLAIGAFEEWTIVDSFYYGVTTVTTVGYGDVTPLSAGGRWITVIYVLIAVTTFAVAFDKLRNIVLQQRLGALVRKVDSNDDNISEGGWKIIISLISIVVCIGVGALTFGYLEDLSAVDAIYFAVVTMTTVGYGDIKMTRNASKMWCTAYMVIGLLVVGFSISTLLGEIEKADKARRERSMEESLKQQKRKSFQQGSLSQGKWDELKGVSNKGEAAKASEGAEAKGEARVSGTQLPPLAPPGEAPGSGRGLQPLPVLGAELGVQAKQQQQQEELVNQLVEEEPSSSSSESEEEDVAGPGNGAAGQPEATGQGNAKSAGDVPEIAIPVSPNPSSGPAAAPSLRTKSPGYRIRKGFRKAVEDLPLFYRCLHCCDKRGRNQVHPARSFHSKQRAPPPKGCWKRTKHIFAEHRLAILLIATLLISAVVTGPIEGWTFVQTAYYTVVTTTTVGYGDLSPTKTSTKIFAVFHLLVNITIVGMILASAQETVINRQMERAVKRANKVNVARKRRHKSKQWLVNIIASLLFLVVIVLGGAGMYAGIEGWSYDDAVYFASVTVTTVGYGDFSPQTEAGMIVTIFFIPLSLVFVGGAFSTITRSLAKKGRHDLHEKVSKFLLTRGAIENAAFSLQKMKLKKKIKRLERELAQVKAEKGEAAASPTQSVQG